MLINITINKKYKKFSSPTWIDEKGLRQRHFIGF